ncbi:MAG: hypothetical protein IPM06_20765 [Rhizobiales bacterium]|nr:hypothetical protein [Hyphomicrobiales bacterium]
MDEAPVQPAAIPEQILTQPQAINLYFVAVIALAIAVVLTIAGGLVLAALKLPVPGELIALGGVALGALAAMVAPGEKGA